MTPGDSYGRSKRREAAAALTHCILGSAALAPPRLRSLVAAFGWCSCRLLLRSRAQLLSISNPLLEGRGSRRAQDEHTSQNASLSAWSSYPCTLDRRLSRETTLPLSA